MKAITRDEFIRAALVGSILGILLGMWYGWFVAPQEEEEPGEVSSNDDFFYQGAGSVREWEPEAWGIAPYKEGGLS